MTNPFAPMSFLGLSPIRRPARSGATPGDLAQTLTENVVETAPRLAAGSGEGAAAPTTPPTPSARIQATPPAPSMPAAAAPLAPPTHSPAPTVDSRSCRDLVLAVARTLPQPFDRPTLVMACWRLHPERFCIRGHIEHPDSNRVLCRLSELKTSRKVRGTDGLYTVRGGLRATSPVSHGGTVVLGGGGR